MRLEDINALESESGVIATLIHHPEYVVHSEHLLPNHFTNKENQLVYCAITMLVDKGVYTADPYNIVEVLNSSDSTRALASGLDVEQLIELVDMSDVIARHTVEEYKIMVDNIMDAAFRRDAFRVLRECEALCVRDSVEDVKTKIYQAIDEIMVNYTVNDEIPKYSEIIDSMYARIKTKQGGGVAGIPFKIPVLNEYVTIERGELVIFGAQQKVGKSIWLLNCAVDLLRRGFSVLYIDSELSTESFTSRLLSHMTGIKHRDLKSGNYPEEDEKLIEDCIYQVKNWNFTHMYMPFFDAENIYSAVKQVHHIRPIDVLIVDYFKSTGDDKDAFQTYASMGRCVDMVKNEIAGSMNIAAIGAAQATAYNRLADSAKIARNASTIVMLMEKEPEDIEEDGEGGGNRKMIVTFNRNGPNHSSGEWINLDFDGDRMTFGEAASQHVPQTPY